MPSAGSTTKKGGKTKVKPEAKKRKIGDDESNDTANEVMQLEKTVDFYKNEYNEVLVKLNDQETREIDQETEYLRIIAKKDEKIRIQDVNIGEGEEEILRLRASVRELEAENERFRQRLADKEKADRESEEAEADRQFIARQNAFRDLLNRYEPSFPLKYKKFYSYPRYRRKSSAPLVMKSTQLKGLPMPVDRVTPTGTSQAFFLNAKIYMLIHGIAVSSQAQ